MKHGNTDIDDTFAEGFSMRFTRLIITAIDRYWLAAAVQEFCGYGTSVIQCDAEAGVEAEMLTPEQTPDARVGAAVMAFGFSADALHEAVTKRVGQCVMTCPTTAVFDGMQPFAQSESPDENAGKTDELMAMPLGDHLRFFGDGYQKSKVVGDRRFWRIPVMDGEFIVEDTMRVAKGVAGGNFLIQSVDQETGLVAARRAVDAIAELPHVITPFPGGVVRSGSKVGSRYKALRASTYEAFCPTLRGRVESRLHPDANCVYEIVVDGADVKACSNAVRLGVEAAIGDGIVGISAGNYGGKLGKHQFHLHEILGKIT